MSAGEVVFCTAQGSVDSKARGGDCFPLCPVSICVVNTSTLEAVWYRSLRGLEFVSVFSGDKTAFEIPIREPISKKHPRGVRERDIPIARVCEAHFPLRRPTHIASAPYTCTLGLRWLVFFR